MEIDYTLLIKKEKAEFKPRKEIKNPLENSEKRIFEINAGNGYGKTFLLNLIAYALFADKLTEDSILNTLKERVSDYNNTDAYNLTYNLNFRLPNGKKIIFSKSENTDRIVHFENEAPMGVNNLHNLISILYDVPIDPNLRLNDVIKDLGIWNNRLKDKFVKYNGILDEIQSQFSNLRDDDKIERLKNEKNDLEKSSEEKKETLTKNKTKIFEYSNYLELEKLINEYQISERLHNELVRLEKELKKFPKPKKVDKKDELLIKTLHAQQNELKKQISQKILDWLSELTKKSFLLEQIENDKSRNSELEYIRTNTIESLIDSSINQHAFSLLVGKIDFLSLWILNSIEKEENAKKYLIHNFLKQLLEQIDELIENDADSILKVLTQNDTDILKAEIKNRIAEHQIEDYSKLKSLSRNCSNEISTIFSQLSKINTKIENETQKKGVDGDGEQYYRFKNLVEECKNKIKRTNDNISIRIHHLTLNLNQNEELFKSKQKTQETRDALKRKFNFSLDTINLQDEINSLEKQNQHILSQISSNQQSIALIAASLQIEEKKNYSSYTLVQQERIKKFKRAIQIFIKNFGEFNRLIENINKGDFNQFTNKEDLDFINVAGKIIAYTLDNKLLRSDGNYIDLEYYDIINKEFHCENNIVIRKNDIATGLASANYLRQRIENIEGQYVIILLDEIGNMSKDTLQEVINSIKRIESQNRLIVSIFTQPSSSHGEIVINKY